jgi:hypothetical protein
MLTERYTELSNISDFLWIFEELHFVDEELKECDGTTDERNHHRKREGKAR